MGTTTHLRCRAQTHHMPSLRLPLAPIPASGLRCHLWSRLGNAPTHRLTWKHLSAHLRLRAHPLVVACGTDSCWRSVRVEVGFPAADAAAAAETLPGAVLEAGPPARAWHRR